MKETHCILQWSRRITSVSDFSLFRMMFFFLHNEIESVFPKRYRMCVQCLFVQHFYHMAYVRRGLQTFSTQRANDWKKRRIKRTKQIHIQLIIYRTYKKTVNFCSNLTALLSKQITHTHKRREWKNKRNKKKCTLIFEYGKNDAFRRSPFFAMLAIVIGHIIIEKLIRCKWRQSWGYGILVDFQWNCRNSISVRRRKKCTTLNK